ncbi:MAG TPA: hypothetical protein VGG96_10565 [Steroidobacteraceae bacterium]|jgi:hypothetical protein
MRTTATMLLVLALAGLPPGRVMAEPWGAPAIITHPTPASRAALERAVSQALTHGAPVRLAPDALTHQSLLIVGHAQVRDARGIPLNGRELGRPQHFRLLRRGSKCVLLHVETDKLSLLAHTTCRPILSDSVSR